MISLEPILDREKKAHDGKWGDWTYCPVANILAQDHIWRSTSHLQDQWQVKTFWLPFMFKNALLLIGELFFSFREALGDFYFQQIIVSQHIFGDKWSIHRSNSPYKPRKVPAIFKCLYEDEVLWLSGRFLTRCCYCGLCYWVTNSAAVKLLVL